METHLQDGRDRGLSGAAPTRLCRPEEIPEGQARGFSLPAAREGEPPLEVLVWRRGAQVFGYLNACPHVGTPLEWLPDRFMSRDGRHLQCSTHGALFRPEDGFCVFGPCKGDRLRPFALARDAEGYLLFSGNSA